MADGRCLPGHFERHPTAQPKAPDAPLRPSLWQGGKQVDILPIRLGQHLQNAGGTAKIAVDLKRRVGVKQVGIAAGGMQQALQNAEGPCRLAGWVPGRDAVMVR